VKTGLIANLENSARGDPSVLEGCAGGADPRVLHRDNLSVCCQNHRQIHCGGLVKGGRGVFHTHDPSVDLEHSALQLGNEDVQLWCSGVQPHSSLPFPREKGTNSTLENHENATGSFPGQWIALYNWVLRLPTDLEYAG
jgi:hypothetical protein